MRLTIKGDFEKVINGLVKQTGLTPTQVIENIIVAALGEAAARIQHYEDKNQGYIVGLQAVDEGGGILTGDELYEQVKLLKVTELAEYERLRRICDAATFQGMRPAGEA